MSVKPGDVVEFTKSVSDPLVGRVCKLHAGNLWWVHFPPPFNCMPVRESDLKITAGDAPDCTGCPG
jgi:hypothetical protein